MNTDIYDYVTTFTKKIKNKEDIDDVQQQVLLILCEKQIMEKELDDPLKNYIKGIIWNYSTTLFNQFNINTTYIPEDYDIVSVEEEPQEEVNKEYKQLLSDIRRYVFNKYYKRNKSITKWKVFFLIHYRYDFKYISQRLDITYRTVIEYSYQCNKEITKVFGNNNINIERKER